jgi:glycosyltransferase involved in cell wall biosynthesis
MNAPDASPPDVSLVVPVRNEAGNIGPLIAEIRTVLDGAGLAWELFVIDDGSSDDTLKIARTFEPRAKVLTGPNQGVRTLLHEIIQSPLFQTR